MSDLSNQAQKLLDGFCQTVDRMKSAYSRVDAKMSVWAEDIYAVEAVMSFLETIRDAPVESARASAIEECAKIAENNGWEATAAQIRDLALPTANDVRGILTVSSTELP